MTTPEQLEQFAVQCEAASAWTFSMNQTLGQLVGKPVKTTDAFDSVFRMRPVGWRFGMGENPVDPRRATVDMYQWDNWQPRGATVVANGITLLVGLVAAMARAHAVVLRQTGFAPNLTASFNIGDLVMVRTRESGTPSNLPNETNVYTTAMEGSVRRLMNSANNGYEWEMLPLDGSDDPWFVGVDNLCRVDTIRV